LGMSAIRSLHLEKVFEYNEKGKISDEVLKSFYMRLPCLEKAIEEVEKASGIGYPPIFFDPVLRIISYPAAEYSNGVIYALSNIRQFGEGYRLCIDISLPFLLYAPEDTLRACIAHEFLHYVFITLAIGNKQLMSLSSDGVDVPEAHILFDETHTVKAEDWLDSKELRGMVQKVFSPIVKEHDLERSIKERWIELGLPSVKISADENSVKIPIMEIDRLPLDGKIFERAKNRPQSAIPKGQVF
jgi:hypothetical protein